MPIHEQLELTARVAAAEPLVPLWDLHHPARPHLTTSDEIADALRAGSPHDNDRLLLRLAELAHVDGGGSLDAAAVLAKLVLPGVGAGCGDVLLSGRGPRWISTLQRCYGSPAGRSRTGRPNGWRRRSRGECSERPSTSWAAAARAQPGLPPSLPEIRPGGLTMPSTREPDREAAEDLADPMGTQQRNAERGRLEAAHDVGPGEQLAACVPDHAAWAALGAGVADGCGPTRGGRVDGTPTCRAHPQSAP